MRLRADRLTLRTLVPSDAPDIVRHANDIEIARWLLQMPHPYTNADARTFIAAQATSRSGGLTYAICLNDKAVGCIGTKGEFGYWLGRSVWGQGLATEAAHLILTQHFEIGGADLTSSHAVDNARSARVLEKCGFRYTGEDTQRVGVLQDKDYIHRLMVLTRADWAARA